MSIKHSFTFLTTLIAFTTAASAATAKEQPGPNSSFGFEANRGQTAAEVRYLARTSDGVVFLTANEMVLHRGDAVVRFQLLGVNAKAGWEVSEPAGETISYFVGRDSSKWVRDLQRYGRVTRRGVYPGIDMVLYGNGGRLEYDFVLAPHVDPSKIRMRVSGARKMSIDETGALVVETAEGVVRQRTPLMYQAKADGHRRAVRGGFRLLGANQVGFTVEDRDPAEPLSIDPLIEFSTYMGGSYDDRLIWTDGNQSVGMTASIDFPDTGFTRTRGNDVVIRFGSRYGQRVLIVGGRGDEQVTSVVGPSINTYSGTILIGGYTDSDDLPTGVDVINNQSSPYAPWQANYAGGASDGFLITLSRDSSSITYFGTPGDDRITAISGSCATNSQCALVGTTNSAGLPTGTYFSGSQAAPAGGLDGFLAIFYTSGAYFQGSTYFGGSGDDRPLGICQSNSTLDYVVTGETRSPDFPLVNPLYSERRGDSDAFLTRISVQAPPDKPVTFSTLLGGTGDDRGLQVFSMSDRTILVGGATSSTDFPTIDALQSTYGGGRSDAFLVRLTPNLDRIVSSTYWGGSGEEEITQIAGYYNDFFAAGWTSSPDFPVRGAAQASFGGGESDGFLLHLNPKLALHQSTYFGGSGADRILGLYPRSGPTVLICGVTGSPDLPLKDATQETLIGGTDGFVARISSKVIGAPAVINLGKDLHSSFGVTLGAEDPAFQSQVKVISSDPSVVRVAAKATDPGQEFLLLPPPSPTSMLVVYAECLADQGGADLTISTDDYPPATVRVNCSPAYLTWGYSARSVYLWSGPTTLMLYLTGVSPDGTTTTFAELRPGVEPFQVQLENSNPEVGTLSATSVPVDGKTSQLQQVSFTPLAIGETDISFTCPELKITPPGKHTYKVLSPISTVSSLEIPVGFQSSLSVSLGSAAPYGKTIRVTSADPSRVVVSTDANQPGTGEISTTSGYIQVQALAPAEETVLTLSVDDLPPTTVKVRTAQPEMAITPASLSLGEGQQGSLYMFIRAAGAKNVSSYRLNPGVSFGKTQLETSDAKVASLSSTSFTFGTSVSQTVGVLAGGAGSATVTVKPPEGIASSNSTSATVVVTRKALRMDDIDLGKDLKSVMTIQLPGITTASSAKDAVITVDDPSLVLLSPNSTTAATASITVPVPQGVRSLTFFAHGLAASGKVKVAAQIPGVGSITANAVLRPAGFIWNSETYSTVLYASSYSTSNAYVMALAIDADTRIALAQQSLRTGVTAELGVTVEDPSIVGFSPSPIKCTSATTTAIAIIGKKAGTTGLRLVQPPGFLEPSVRQRASVTVLQPSFGVSSASIAKDTQAPISIDSLANLELPLTITSSDASRLLLSTDPTQRGSASVTFPDLRKRTTVYAQSLASEGTATITASVPTYKDAKTTVTLVPATLRIYPEVRDTAIQDGKIINTSTQSGRTRLNVVLDAKVPDGVPGTSYNATWRGGADPLRVEVTSSNAAAGTVVNSPVTIAAGASSTTCEFQPAGPGDTEVGIVLPPDFVMPATPNTVAFHVTAPPLIGGAIALGKDLYAPAQASIASHVRPPETNITVTLTSTDPSRVLLSRDANSEAAVSITKPLIAGQRATGEFYIHALGNNGIVPVIISAPGYKDGTWNVALTDTLLHFNSNGPSRVLVQGGKRSASICAAGAPSPSGYSGSYGALVRPGIPDITPQVRSSSQDVIAVDSQPVLRSGSTCASFDYHAVSAGEATLTLEPPDGFLTDSSYNKLSLTVEGARLSFNRTPVYVGRDGQFAQTVGCEIPFTKPTPLVVTSHDPSRLLLSASSTEPGQGSITLTAQPNTTPMFYLQSLADDGPANVSVTSDGYQSATMRANLVSYGAQFWYVNSPVTTRVGGSALFYEVRLGVLDPSTLNYMESYSPRPGTSPSVEVISSDPSVVAVKNSPLQFTKEGTAKVELQALKPGTVIITLGTVPGGVTPSSAQSFVVIAKGDDFTVPSFALSKDLQATVRISLGDGIPTPSSNRDVYVSVSDPWRIAVSGKADMSGGASLGTIIPAGERVSLPFYIQGFANNGTVEWSARSGDFTAKGTVTLGRTAFIFEEANQPQPVKLNAGQPAVFHVIPAVAPLGAPSPVPLSMRGGGVPAIVNAGTTNTGVLQLPEYRLVFQPGVEKVPLTVQPVGPGRATAALWGTGYDFGTPKSSVEVQVSAQ